MNDEKKEYTALKVLSGIVMVILLIGGLVTVFLSGPHYSRFFNTFAIMMHSEHWFLSSAVSTIIIKSVGAMMLMWAFLLFKLIQEPVRNAIVATGSGVGFLILSAVTASHFFSKEIMLVIPPFVIAWRLFVTGIVGLLFLIWTPKR